MFGLAVAAVILVAGELILVTRQDAPEKYTPPSAVSSHPRPSRRISWRKMVRFDARPSSLLSSFVTLFVTIGPIHTAVIFAGLTPGNGAVKCGTS
jgi:hypothetical protein